MAKLRSSKSATGNDELLKALAEKYAEETKPRVGVLSRLLAPIVGIGSGLDAYYDARFGDRNASVGNVLKNYGTNVLQGFQTFATGKQYEDKQQQLSDILDKTSLSFRQGLGKSKFARSALDIAGGIVTDPLTYVTFGAGGLTDDAVKAGAKGLSKFIPKGAGTADDFIKPLVGRTIDDATKEIASKLGQEAADSFYTKALNKMGKSANSGALKVFGQKVTEDARIVEPLKRVTNPFQLGGDLINEGSKRFAPKLRSDFLQVFNPEQAYREAGMSGVAEHLNKFQREMGATSRKSLAELAGTELPELYKQLSKKEKSSLGKMIEKTSSIMGLVDIPEGASDNMKKFLESYARMQEGKTAQLAEAGFKTLGPESMTYISRPTEGYRPQFIDNVLSRELDADTIAKVRNSKSVLNEIERNGYVKADTLRKAIGEQYFGALKKFDLGELGEAVRGDGATYKRVLDTIAQGEELGIVYKDDWMNTIFKQTQRQNEQLIASKAIDDLTKLTDDAGEQIFRNEPVGAFTTPVKVPIANETMTLYTDSRIAKLAEDYLARFGKEEPMNEMLGAFDKVLGLWKGWVTGLGPNMITYNIRNAIDDTVRMIVGGHDVTKLADDYLLAKDVVDYGNLVERIGRDEAKKVFSSKRVDDFMKSVGAKGGVDDLWDYTISNNVFSDIGQLESQAMGGRRTALKQLIGENLSTKEKVMNAATLGGVLPAREQMSRIAHFADSWRRTGSREAGVEAVKNTLFNYQDLTKGEQGLKRLIPFYSFVKNNMKFYLETLTNNPERLAKYKNVLDGLQSGFIGATGEEEWNAMPDHMKEEFSLPLGIKDGNLQVLSNVGLSMEGLNQLDPEKFVSQNLNPLLKNAIEYSTGKNMYQGRDIIDIDSGERYKNYPEAIKKLLGYREIPGVSKDGREYTSRTLAPYAKYTAENLIFLSQLNRLIERTSGLSSGDKDAILQTLTKMGMPGTISEQNIESAKSRKEKEAMDPLYELLKRKGIGKTYERFYIPTGIKEGLLKDLNN